MYKIGHYEFDTKEEYDRAVQENRTIKALAENFDLTDYINQRKVLVLYYQGKVRFESKLGLDFIAKMKYLSEGVSIKPGDEIPETRKINPILSIGIYIISAVVVIASVLIIINISKGNRSTSSKEQQTLAIPYETSAVEDSGQMDVWDIDIEKIANYLNKEISTDRLISELNVKGILSNEKGFDTFTFTGNINGNEVQIIYYDYYIDGDNCFILDFGKKISEEKFSQLLDIKDKVKVSFEKNGTVKLLGIEE